MRDHNHLDHFPAGCTECERCFFLQTRGLEEHFACERGNDRENHDGENDAAHENVTARRDERGGVRCERPPFPVLRGIAEARQATLPNFVAVFEPLRRAGDPFEDRGQD